jgi:hypothetical protein
MHVAKPTLTIALLALPPPWIIEASGRAKPFKVVGPSSHAQPSRAESPPSTYILGLTRSIRSEIGCTSP